MIKPNKSHLENQEKCHPSFKKIRDRNGRENGLFFLALISLSLAPRNPPTTYTNNNGHVLCIDIQTDR